MLTLIERSWYFLMSSIYGTRQVRSTASQRSRPYSLPDKKKSTARARMQQPGSGTPARGTWGVFSRARARADFQELQWEWTFGSAELRSEFSDVRLKSQNDMTAKQTQSA